MGISTLQSYCGAQIFEAIGLDQELVDRYFTWTASRIGGVGHRRRSRRRRWRGTGARSRSGRWAAASSSGAASTSGGATASTTSSTRRRCSSCSTRRAAGSTGSSRSTPQLVDDQSQNRATLRGLFELRYAPKPIPLDEVEPVEAIVQRFATGAMSYGSISQEAHETLAIAMNRIGGKSNTGEGGEDPARYRRDAERRLAAQRDQAGRLRRASA